jgi:integral membrane protein (TIGR00529 family)
MDGWIKLALVFIGIVIAIRLKFFVGYTLYVAGLALAVLYKMGFMDILLANKNLLFSERFLSLYIIIVLITFLGRLLKEIGYLNRLVEASREMVGGARTAAALLPALVGLMPMPGGAMLSAPLVAEVLPKGKYSPEFMTIVNYWSRHIIEFCWPIYPGLILSAALASLNVGQIALLQMPLTLIMIPVGLMFFIRQIKEKGEGKGDILRPAIKILSAIWPILLSIFIPALFSIELLWGVVISLIILIIIERPNIKRVIPVCREACSPKLLALVFGILFFQQILEITGSVGSIPRLTLDMGFPPIVVIFALTFTVGLLTGMVTAFIGLSYPLLSGYLFQPEPNLANIYFAYLSGYMGMILSPTHFCLVLTNEYFGSNLGKVYRQLAIPLGVFFIGGVLLYLLGYPWQIFNWLYN